MKRQYTYTVLRYVHDPISAEFVNVGVVLFCPSVPGAPAVLKASTRKTFGRVRDVFPDLDREAFKQAMRTIGRQLERLSDELTKEGLLTSDGDATVFAQRVLPKDDSSLQWSPGGSGITADINKAFDRLCTRFITRYDNKYAQRRSDEEIWKPVRQRLSERALLVDFEPKTIIGSDDAIVFQHAWKNGAWHVYEPVSLDLADAEGINRKAYRWLGQLTSLGEVAEPFQTNFIVGAPTDPSLEAAYRHALKILSKPTNVTIYEENQIDQLIDKIEDDVNEHYGRDQEPLSPFRY